MPSASPSTEKISRYRAYYVANRDKRLAYKKQYYAKHRASLLEKSTAWRKENATKSREYVRAANVKNRYGLTREEHAAMHKAQGGRCAICNHVPLKGSRRLCIDHDHTTGEVRGLICFHCNYVLGHARDRVDVLRSAISYLEKHRT